VITDGQDRHVGRGRGRDGLVEPGPVVVINAAAEGVGDEFGAELSAHRAGDGRHLDAGRDLGMLHEDVVEK
jgi:hypothetical protein